MPRWQASISAHNHNMTTAFRYIFLAEFLSFIVITRNDSELISRFACRCLRFPTVIQMTSARRQLPRKPLSSHSPQHQSLHHVRHALCLDCSSTICGHKRYQPCISIGWSFRGQATRKLPITVTLVYQENMELPVFFFTEPDHLAIKE